MNKKVGIYFISIVFLLGIVFIAWKFNVISQIGQKIRISQELRTVHKASNYVINTLEPTEISKGIPELEKILNNPTTIKIEAEARVLLGLAYVYGSDKDVVAGIKILKDVAVNNNYPKVQRAIAVQHITEIIDSYPESFAKQYVFVGQPFESFYKNENFGVALRNLDEWADELYPIAVPNYRIAHWYAERLIRNKINPYLSKSKEKQYFDILKQRLERADALFKTVPMDEWNQDRLLLCYLLKARILEKLYFVNGGDKMKNDARNYFQLALDVNNKYFSPKGIGLTTPFHYAAFLSETSSGNQADIDKIKSFLEPIYSASRDKNSGFFSFLEREKMDTHNTHYHKREILLVTKFNSAFRDLLKQLGWTDEQLNIKIKSLAEQK